MDWEKVHLGVMWGSATVATGTLAWYPSALQAGITTTVVLLTLHCFRDAERRERLREGERVAANSAFHDALLASEAALSVWEAQRALDEARRDLQREDE